MFFVFRYYVRIHKFWMTQNPCSEKKKVLIEKRVMWYRYI